jgi:hypothetical protein
MKKVLIVLLLIIAVAGAYVGWKMYFSQGIQADAFDAGARQCCFCGGNR